MNFIHRPWLSTFYRHGQVPQHWETHLLFPPDLPFANTTGSRHFHWHSFMFMVTDNCMSTKHGFGRGCQCCRSRITVSRWHWRPAVCHDYVISTTKTDRYQLDPLWCVIGCSQTQNNSSQGCWKRQKKGSLPWQPCLCQNDAGRSLLLISWLRCVWSLPPNNKTHRFVFWDLLVKHWWWWCVVFENMLYMCCIDSIQ